MINKEYDKLGIIDRKTDRILYYILMGGGIALASLIAPQLPAQLLKAYLKNKKFDIGHFNRDIDRLSSNGDIKMQGDSVIITKKGKKRVLKYRLNEMEIQVPDKWDRKWRLVVFDIPNKYRHTSNTLRHKLIELGFLQYQKSIFILPYDCRNEIDFIREVFGIGCNVKLIIAETIDDEEHFLRKFHLN